MSKSEEKDIKTEGCKDTAKEEKSVKPEKSSKKDKTDAIKKELEKALEESAANKDLLLRTAAEYENYKRRTMQEKERIGADTRASTIKELLPVIDNLERAAENLEASPEDLKKGIEMISKQLSDILAKLGLEEINALGQPFDLNLHYAVSSVTDDSVGENTVVAVMQKGYKIGDNVIRPAIVTVANC